MVSSGSFVFLEKKVPAETIALKDKTLELIYLVLKNQVKGKYIQAITKTK